MNSIVIYASHFGNTARVAQVIATELRTQGSVRVYSADEVPFALPPGTDFVVIGGPTEQHGMTRALSAYVDGLRSGALDGVAVAVFDTRLRWPRWLSGSAATDIVAKLGRTGARIIAPPESFFIKGIAGTGGSSNAELGLGELERAGAWARALAGKLPQHASAVSG